MTLDNETNNPYEVEGDVFYEVPSATITSQSSSGAAKNNARSRDFEDESDDGYGHTFGDEEDQVGPLKSEETESKEVLVGKSLREGYLQFGPSSKKKARFGKIILQMRNLLVFLI